MFRRDLVTLLTAEPRSVSSIAREMGMRRQDLEEDLRHALRSARAAGYRLVIVPARCRGCDFSFDESRLAKPSKCPTCRGTRILEAQIALEAGGQQD